MSDPLPPTPPPLPPPPPAAPPPLPAAEETVEPSAPASVGEPGLLARLSDRLNPILVREVNQALNGKAFLVTACLALAAILLIALLVAAREETSAREGRETFALALQVLAPILLFIVPFQAFLSMRGEVGGGTVEHLLMSRLGPGAIMRGKLMAATVQFVIYLAIFSPLIGMTFLLRGVDVPTIATMLSLSFVYALAASAYAIACGALCRWRSFFRVIPFGLILVGLLWFTGMSMAFIGLSSNEVVRALAEPHFGRYLLMFILPPAVLIILCAMVGSAVLAHPYENRSSKFRFFALAWILLGGAWILYDYNAMLTTAAAVPSGTYLGYDLAEGMTDFIGVSAGILFVFALFAATEPNKLSPRVHARVSRRRWLALLSAPFLPGTGRGMLFVVMLAVVAVGWMLTVPVLGGASSGGVDKEAELAIVGWLYVIGFCGVAAFVRSRLAEGAARDWIARGVFPVLLLASSILPLLVGLVSGRRPSGNTWNPLHVFNPASTVYEWGKHPWMRDDIMSLLTGICVVVVAVNIPSMVMGVREVMAASAARRRREALIEEALTDEILTDEILTDETPTHETPTHETPTHETPTHETPTDETPGTAADADGEGAGGAP